MTDMQTQLWGGPLDGQHFDATEPVKREMVIPKLTQWPPEYAEDGDNFIRHHYVFDPGVGRYNYAGDWP
jgi:hypothetical protein